MSYCILRTKKLKSICAVARSARHTFRQDETPNADPKRTPQNRLIGAKTSSSLLGSLRELLPAKRRKDAVLTIEYLITASPEFFKSDDGNTITRSSYFNNALEFLRLKHGKNNIISAALHLDETTPHLVVYAVPINAAGRLCAKDFLGGRAKLSQLQTEFFERVGANFGLKRGIQGSRARHQDIKKFYSNIQVQPELHQLSTIDKVACILGFKTAAAQARRQQELELLAHAKAFNRDVIIHIKDDQSRLADKVKLEQRRSIELAENLVQTKDAAHKLETELDITRSKLEAAKQVAIEHYRRNQILQSLENSSSQPPSPETNHASKNSKPRMAR